MSDCKWQGLLTSIAPSAVFGIFAKNALQNRPAAIPVAFGVGLASFGALSYMSVDQCVRSFAMQPQFPTAVALRQEVRRRDPKHWTLDTFEIAHPKHDEEVRSERSGTNRNKNARANAAMLTLMSSPYRFLFLAGAAPRCHCPHPAAASERDAAVPSEWIILTFKSACVRAAIASVQNASQRSRRSKRRHSKEGQLATAPCARHGVTCAADSER